MVKLFDEQLANNQALHELKLIAHDLRKMGARSQHTSGTPERGVLIGMNIALQLIENAIARVEGKTN